MNFDSGLRKVAVALYCHLNTPKSLACEIALRYKEFGELASMAAQPAHYLEGPWGAEKYRRDAQACDFLRKSPLLPMKVSKRKAAEMSFFESEKQCSRTNAMLIDMLQFPGLGEPYQERLRHILCDAEKIFKRILGRLPDSLSGRFGPGTSYELKGQAFTTYADKLWIQPHATQEALALFEHEYWSTLWGRTRLSLDLPLPGIVLGNRFTTVPKDATKDRGICVEPLGNLWGQLGIGGVMKRRLGAVGLYVGKTKPPACPVQQLRTKRVRDGQYFHQHMAWRSSLTGQFCTIDLSNASDTVAYELVKWVTPPDWFAVIDALRSPFTLIKGKNVRLEKFSSMGNGLTFELETGVFASILAAGLKLVVGQDLWVYGDDIILPAHLGREAMAILQACGFTPNMKKSFLSGPFRESCGGDFFSGNDVRSCFADGTFESPLEWISLHNQLRRKWPGAVLSRKRCVEQIPSWLRLKGPERLGDQVLHSEHYNVEVLDGIPWVATVEAQPVRIPLERWGSEFAVSLLLLGASSSGLVPRCNGEDLIAGYRISKASVG